MAHRCSHCQKVFSLLRHLRDHMRSHVNHYKCPQCEMTCTNQSNLNSHIKHRHSDSKPFPCELCSYRAKTSSDINKHMEVCIMQDVVCCSMQFKALGTIHK